MSNDKPNILLIQADQLAACSLPCYGNPMVQSPNIDALAEDGVVFEGAYYNNPICAPSRFSMLSGQLTSNIQAFDNGPNFQPISRPLPITSGWLGARHAWRAKCISSVPTNSMAMKPG
ncbi:sulfatase family protein [Desulfosarcina variabilis str. Montpellier]|uniref:sulfatase-like hydrolase/transferase n=1 Tax=Desulfosarcina variabilis TaxID=2300 RepID=UPI003AFA2920